MILETKKSTKNEHAFGVVGVRQDNCERFYRNLLAVIRNPFPPALVASGIGFVE